MSTTERQLAELDGAIQRASTWVQEYLQTAGERPVLAQVAPGEIRSWLPDAPPEQGEPLDHLLDDFEELVLPGITHWHHPRFFSYFSTSTSAPGILAELLIATLNANAMLWRTSPAATEVEEVACDWLRQAIGLAEGFSGVINDTASAGTLYALTAARDVADPTARAEGVDGRRLRYYTSEEAHSSVEKAGIVLGVGQRGVVRIATDAELRLDVRELERAVARDRDAGLQPFAVVANVGTTSTTSIDPVPAIADLCEREGLWLHVDAAYGGMAAMLPSHRWVLDGCERADSVVVNPHKWLFTPVDCSVLFCRREDVLRRAFSIVPPYLAETEPSEVRNLMDFGTSLGRRFRGLKLWFVLRAFGLEGVRELLAGHLRMAQDLRSWVEEDPAFELLAPVPFSTVCFAHRDGDARTERIVEEVNASGLAFVSHTKVRGRYAIRMAIGNSGTTPEDVRAAWDRIQEAAAVRA
jgi:aromatic-L-amino-acid/L-tryptophan decarboxylase